MAASTVLATPPATPRTYAALIDSERGEKILSYKDQINISVITAIVDISACGVQGRNLTTASALIFYYHCY